MDGFVYNCALQGRDIRLIKVMPGTGMGTLTVHLVEKALDEAEYDALSYVWGDQKRRVPIQCDGKWLNIGANLSEALHEWRRRRRTTLLWADQICINQDDIIEKTHQVRLMRAIYKRADRVTIWLGKQQPEDLNGYLLAKRLYVRCNGKEYDADTGIYDFHDFDCKSKGFPDPAFNSTWTALFKIISNSWFGRAWVVQELLAAQKSVMWKGTLNLDTDVILWLAMLVGRHRNLYICFDITMGSPQYSKLMARNTAASYYEFKKTGPRAIYDVLSRHPGIGTTDSRDRFFALAGVSLDLDPAFVDYRKTFREVACLVGKMTVLGFPAYRLAQDGTELLVLRDDPSKHRFLIDWLAFHANPQNDDLGLPSWVPDLLSPHSPGLVLTGFYQSLYLQEQRHVPNIQVRFGEQRSSMAQISPVEWALPVPEMIEIEGSIFDHVRVVARNRPPLPSQSRTTTNGRADVLTAFEAMAQYESEIVSWLSDIRLLADPSLDPKGGIMDGSSFDTFWRTLIYNRGPLFNYSAPNRQADDSLAINFGYWYLRKKFRMARRWRGNPLIYILHDKILEKLAEPFEEAEGRVRHARKFFVSGQGRIGWIPFRARVGDQVCVFRGMRIPLVLRRQGVSWKIIGACYVHGMMDEEVWDLDGLHWEFMSFV